MSDASPLSPTRPPISPAELFVGFLTVGLQGFGGVLPWARRMMVERRRWLDEADYLDLLSLGQLTPGPNIVNLSIVFGARQAGLVGAVAAVTGLLAAPFVIVVALGLAYREVGSLPALQVMLSNLGGAAAGLVIANAIKLGRTGARTPVAIGVALATFLAAGILRWPLVLVVLGLGPIAVLLAGRNKG